MQSLNQKEKEIVMKMETEGLSPTQIRLVKTIHSLMANVLAADEEAEYFEASAELFKKAAELVKHSGFACQNNKMSYGEQAVEFSVDCLSEAMEESKIQNLDN